MLGKNIKILREKRGLTQEELAQKTGMHTNTIARWERDEVDPRGTSLWKLAKALNVSSATLLTGEENISESEEGMGMHGISFDIPLDETLISTQEADEEMQKELIREGKLKPENTERFNGRTFYAGRTGHLYSPAPFKGISFWGEVLDAADFAAERGDKRELSRIEPLLRDAYETIANALKEKLKDNTESSVRNVNKSNNSCTPSIDTSHNNIG